MHDAMDEANFLKQPRRSMKCRFQRLIQTNLWNVDIDSSAFIYTSALIDRTRPRHIHIGAWCIIGKEAVVLTHNMMRGIYMDTHVGEGRIIGARAIVMPGIRIGQSCIVRLGTLVTKDMADGTVSSGNPAQIAPL